MDALQVADYLLMHCRKFLVYPYRPVSLTLFALFCIRASAAIFTFVYFFLIQCNIELSHWCILLGIMLDCGDSIIPEGEPVAQFQFYTIIGTLPPFPIDQVLWNPMRQMKYELSCCDIYTGCDR